MKKALSVLMALLVVGLLLGSAAAAQDDSGDGPAITLDPVSLEEPGTTDVTVTGSGYTLDVFVLQCPGANGSLETLADGDGTTLCDIGNITPASPDADGNFEVVLTGVEVGDCGLVIAASDAGQEESGSAAIAVENPAEDADCEGASEVEGAGYDTTEATELADTGPSELIPIIIIAVAAVLFGIFVNGEARRLVGRLGR